MRFGSGPAFSLGPHLVSRAASLFSLTGRACGSWHVQTHVPLPWGGGGGGGGGGGAAVRWCGGAAVRLWLWLWLQVREAWWPGGQVARWPGGMDHAGPRHRGWRRFLVETTSSVSVVLWGRAREGARQGRVRQHRRACHGFFSFLCLPLPSHRGGGGTAGVSVGRTCVRWPCCAALCYEVLRYAMRCCAML